jgi:hypothetical protein
MGRSGRRKSRELLQSFKTLRSNSLSRNHNSIRIGISYKGSNPETSIDALAGILVYIQVYILVYILVYIQVYIQVYIGTGIHTGIHTGICTYWQVYILLF